MKYILMYQEKKLYPKGIILNKHNIDNQAVTCYFNFIFKGYQYIDGYGLLLID